jgi:hypothetical protein
MMDQVLYLEAEVIKRALKDIKVQQQPSGKTCATKQRR